MPLLLLLLAIVLLEQTAPGALSGVLGSIAAAVLAPGALGGVALVLVFSALIYSAGRTSLAREQRDAAIEKAEQQYQKDKGII